jgi:hypothetical protein
MRWTWAAAICQGAKPQLSRIGGRASVLSEPAPPTPVCPALLARVALGMGRSRPGTKGMRLSAQGERIKYSRPGGTQSRATYILRQNLGCGQRPCSAGERRRSSPTDGRPSKILKPRGSCGVTLRSPTRCEKSLHVPTPRGGTESSNLLCSSGESANRWFRCGDKALANQARLRARIRWRGQGEAAPLPTGQDRGGSVAKFSGPKALGNNSQRSSSAPISERRPRSKRAPKSTGKNLPIRSSRRAAVHRRCDPTARNPAPVVPGPRNAAR